MFVFTISTSKIWRPYTSARIHDVPSKLKLPNNQTARGCNNNAAMQNNYFHICYRRRIPGTFVGQQSGIGDVCQSGNMARQLNLLFFVSNVSFLLNYRVKYCEHNSRVVQWRSMRLMCVAGHCRVLQLPS